MMGCHFQDRPCKASLCLRGLHAGEGRASLLMCGDSTEASCPHRAWDHSIHLEVCSRRDDHLGRCPGCNDRHSTMMEAMRCELARSIQRAFSNERNEPVPLDEDIPPFMRSSAWRMIRKSVIERDGCKCRLCEKDLSNVPSWLTEVHHIQPRVKGGQDHPSNLITICTMCHKRVTTDELLAESHRRSAWEEVLPRECLEALR